VAATTLYLVRHSQAEGAHPAGDRHRALTAEGRGRIARLLPRALERGFGADLALSSPYLRALQTREAFLGALGSPRLAESPVLTPSASVAEALDELGAWESEGWRRIAVFTHNPFVTELAATLAEAGTLDDLEFRPATILALAFDRGLTPGGGRVLWTLQP